jgi:uncharacterized OB-fold protein
MTPMRRMAEYASSDKLALQRCIACGTMQYPPRELCAACLADEMIWVVAGFADGDVLAVTTLHHSHEVACRAALPLRVGLVRLDAGPTVVCFLDEGCAAGTRVQIAARTDAAGRAVLAAIRQG